MSTDSLDLDMSHEISHRISKFQSRVFAVYRNASRSEGGRARMLRCVCRGLSRPAGHRELFTHDTTYLWGGREDWPRFSRWYLITGIPWQSVWLMWVVLPTPSMLVCLSDQSSVQRRFIRLTLRQAFFVVLRTSTPGACGMKTIEFLFEGRVDRRCGLRVLVL